MNPRLAAIAAFCREGAIPLSVLASIAAFGSPGINHIAAAPIVSRLAPLLAANANLAADAKFADKPQPVALRAVDTVAASIPMAKAAVADPIPASPESQPIVTASLTNSSDMLPADTAPAQQANTSLTARDPEGVIPAASPTEVVDECFAVDSCIDRFLWGLYQRTPKEDSVKMQQQRQVTVKKKGKLVVVTRTFTALADEDFSWKDPKAADAAAMPIEEYVIDGMDRDFKLKLFQMLRAAERAGLSPGITSAFRDDYRQSIASGLKAANDRSYHGGSFHGGYGHGLAADIVSVNGATRAQRLNSTETFWKWVDAHGAEFGIGRPYLGRDPPHVGPIDGKEYADHRPGMKARLAAAAAKPANQAALHDEHGTAKRARTARSSRVSTI
jgi:LAS superfamily LD-carboxypeptidase LdcB